MCTYTYSIQRSADRTGITYDSGQGKVNSLSSREKQNGRHLEETHSAQLISSKMGKEQWKKPDIKEAAKKIRQQKLVLRTRTGRLKVLKGIYLPECQFFTFAENFDQEQSSNYCTRQQD